MKWDFLIIFNALICGLFCSCSFEAIDPNRTPFEIIFDFADRPLWESWPDKDSEINVNMIIRSQFSDDAFIALWAEKLYSPYTVYHVLDTTANEPAMDSIVYHPSICESFKDSLNVDGFFIRAYMQFYYSYVGISDEYPIYFKKISVKKGKNKEHFKIVFPRNLSSILGQVKFHLGVGRFNDEMKKRFENFSEVIELSEQDNVYKNLYFETYPDSSNTSFVFSNYPLLSEISFFPEVSGNFIGRYYFYTNFIKLNGYPHAPEMRFDEYIYK